MRHLLLDPEVPAAVLDVLQAASAGLLLVDVDTMAAHLEAAGWVREVHGGAWGLPSAPAWSVQSLDDDPSVSVFAGGDDELVARTADHLRGLVHTRQAGHLRPGHPDPHATSWHNDVVEVTLYATTGRSLGPRWVDGVVHLALERTDAPPEGRAHDADLDRRIAREGSPVARWYLAGREVLTDDVVDLLAGDTDPAVVAALAAGEEQRQTTREHRQSS